MSFKQTVSFDDVLLVPRFSDITSRSQVNLKTRLTKKINLNIPIISSNMDSVTEHKMAIAMARLGGIGIIHRFCSIEQQVDMVRRVKRAQNFIIEKPYSTDECTSLSDLVDYMKRVEVGSIMITKGSKPLLVGIVTNRDINLFTNESLLARDIMTPLESLSTIPPGLSKEEIFKEFQKTRVKKLPIVKNGILLGLVTLKDIYRNTTNKMMVTDSEDRLLVGAAIGVKDDYLVRTKALVKENIDTIVIDIAHGHSSLTVDTCRKIKEIYGKSLQVIAGNVATDTGADLLMDAGADAVKVGVGGGSICITRMVTGHGIPTLQSVLDCSIDYKIPIIADGGIKTSGDISKALAAGASTVMLGNLLSGTDESPGRILSKDNKQFKIIRGMAGLSANISKNQNIGSSEKTIEATFDMTPEGVEGLVPYKGSVDGIVQKLCGGVRSAFSYSGAHTISEYHNNAKFVKVSSGGRRESNFHDIQKY